MALASSGQQVELREIVLRDKPAHMVEVSPKATVPVLIADGAVIDESLDVMLWALDRDDPHRLLTPEQGDRAAMLALIEEMDGDFKHHLDNYKYSSRHSEDANEASIKACEHRDAAVGILEQLESRLRNNAFLFGGRRSLADVAIAPFVRQFANVDTEWFASLPLPNVQKWLAEFLADDLFLGIMAKFVRWEDGTAGVVFPD